MAYSRHSLLRAGGGPGPPGEGPVKGRSIAQHGKTKNARQMKAPVALIRCMGSLQKVQQHYYVWDAKSTEINATTQVGKRTETTEQFPSVHETHECHWKYAPSAQHVLLCPRFNSTDKCCAASLAVDSNVKCMHKVACDLSRATGEPCRYTSTTSTPLHFQETNHTWVQTPREWRYPFPEGPVLTSPQSTLPQQCIPRRTDAAALSIVPPDPLSAYDGHTWPAGGSQAVTWIHSDGACTRADCSHEVNASPPMHWSAGSTLCRTDVLPIAWQTSGTELGHNQENYTDNRAAHRVQLGIGCESAGLCGSDAHGPFDGSYDQQPLAIIPRTRDDPGDGSYDQGDLHFSGNAHVNSTLRNWYSQQGVPGRNALQAYSGSEPASTAHQIGGTFSAGTERVTPCIETRWSAAATWPRLPSGESVVGGDVSDLQIWDTEQMLTYDPSDERGEEHLEAFQLHVSHKGET